jgi:hypothetical protein
MVKCNHCDEVFTCDRQLDYHKYGTTYCSSKECICPSCYIKRMNALKGQDYNSIQYYLNIGCWTSFNIKDTKLFELVCML